MSWLILIFAGLLEVVWAVGLKYTEGFTRPVPTIATVAAMVASLYLLGVAMRSLPLGVAYAVWVGIGILGAVILDVAIVQEPLSMPKAISLLLIIAGIVGLKWSVSA